MLLSSKVAVALFIGLGPIFILCLLFDQTKALFHKWLLYGIGTMFSMAVLAAMMSIALDMVIRVAGTFWITALADKFLLDGALTEGMTSMALQQGGMGLILTTPPMAAMFFQGTLGAFMVYSQIGGSPGAAAPGPQGQPPGSYAPQQGSAQERPDITANNHVNTTPRLSGQPTEAPTAPAGSRGNAPL